MRQEFTAFFGGARWLIEPGGLRALLARAAAATPDTVQAAMAAYSDRPTPPPTMVGDVAVIAMCGPIMYRSSWLSEYFGFATIERMQTQFRAALADPAVRQIVWRCDSPGGIVDMVPEFADEIFAARGQKPITFVADTLIASCAYWLASQGDKIIAPRSATIGAIGTYCVHEDISAMLDQAGIKITIVQHGDHKTDFFPTKPLSDDARAELQAYADEVGQDFEAAVARGRGVAKTAVVDTFGQGRVFRGKKAVALGMADAVATFDATLGRLTRRRGVAAMAAAVRGDVADPEEGIEPDADGQCPEGYSKDPGDGLCYREMTDHMDATAVTQRQRDLDLATAVKAVTTRLS